MRYAQLLLEFDVGITAEAMGEKIVARMQKGPALFGVLRPAYAAAKAELGVADNAAFIEPGIQRQLFTLQKQKCVEAIVKFDPTPNRSYGRWLCQRFADGGLPQWDDLQKAESFLRRFDLLKTGGYFKRHTDQAVLADIGRFKTLSDLGEFINGIPDDDAMSNAGQDRALEARLISSGDARVILNTDRFKVTVPLTAEAATFFGRNTQWCTTMENGNHFDYYADLGPLYIILDKPNNRRWQFHFQSKQFIDENDREVYGYRVGDSYTIGSERKKAFHEFPAEFWAVIPPEMFLAGREVVPVEQCPTPIKPGDFVHLTQKDLVQVAHHMRDTEIRKMAVSRMGKVAAIGLYAFCLQQSTTNLRALADILRDHINTMPMDPVNKRVEGRITVVTGNLLATLMDDLRSHPDDHGTDIWKLCQTRHVDTLASMKTGLAMHQLNRSVYTFYKAGEVYYVVLDEDHMFDVRVHGANRDWAATRLDNMRRKSAEPHGNYRTGLSDEECAIIMANLTAYIA